MPDAGELVANSNKAEVMNASGKALYVGCVLILANCSTRALDDGPAALMDADRAFAQTTGERGADGWASYFAEDGTMIVPGQEVSGQAAIRRLMEQSFRDTTFVISWEPQRADVSRSGDLGYTVGRSETSRSDADGSLVTSTGTYVSIWKKNELGVWQVVLDVGAADPPEN